MTRNQMPLEDQEAILVKANLRNVNKKHSLKCGLSA